MPIPKAKKLASENKKEKSVKVAASEEELATRQAHKMLNDMKRLQATQTKSVDQKEIREGVDLWKDSDFFFSVVFQSAAQKYAFLELFSKKFALGIDNARSDDQVIQVVNGLQLASNLGFAIPAEKAPDLPYPNMELAALVLDNEEF